ncbi:hypothetical protein J6590_098855 [Homalodisca vitripennis]|nr:hypothetical protein J6590_098855 [Homalodisca vitripennis]
MQTICGFLLIYGTFLYEEIYLSGLVHHRDIYSKLGQCHYLNNDLIAITWSQTNRTVDIDVLAVIGAAQGTCLPPRHLQLIGTMSLPRQRSNSDTLANIDANCDVVAVIGAAQGTCSPPRHLQLIGMLSLAGQRSNNDNSTQVNRNADCDIVAVIGAAQGTCLPPRHLQLIATMSLGCHSAVMFS